MKSSLPTKLPVSGWTWYGHYSLPIQFAGMVLVLVGCVLFVVPSNPEHAVPTSGEIGGLGLLSVCMLAVAGLVVRRQRRVLALEHYETPEDAKENFRRLIALASKEGWRISVADPGHLRMHVPARWSDPCWGEMVSVFLERNIVALNSICDPTKSNPSVASFGRNAKNVEKVKTVLQII